MTEIDSNFKFLRVKLRQFGVEISDDVFKRYHPATIKIKEEICVFCNSTDQITKEHVLPRWVFEKNTENTLISSVNKQTQTYNKAVIPTCALCNNSILAQIENHIIKVIQRLETCETYNDVDLKNVIRWLQILDYKLQVFDCRRKYIKYGKSEYSSDWGIIPISMMRHFIDMNPFLAYNFLRQSQRRITVKAKTIENNSLIIFDTVSPHFNFFTQPNEYIFISFPMNKIAIFLFLKKKFSNSKEATDEAYYIMKNVFAT